MRSRMSRKKFKAKERDRDYRSEGAIPKYDVGNRKGDGNCEKSVRETDLYFTNFENDFAIEYSRELSSSVEDADYSSDTGYDADRSSDEDSENFDIKAPNDKSDIDDYYLSRSSDSDLYPYRKKIPFKIVDSPQKSSFFCEISPQKVSNRVLMHQKIHALFPSDAVPELFDEKSAYNIESKVGDPCVKILLERGVYLYNFEEAYVIEYSSDQEQLAHADYGADCSPDDDTETLDINDLNGMSDVDDHYKSGSSDCDLYPYKTEIPFEIDDTSESSSFFCKVLPQIDSNRALKHQKKVALFLSEAAAELFHEKSPYNNKSKKAGGRCVDSSFSPTSFGRALTQSRADPLICNILHEHQTVEAFSDEKRDTLKTNDETAKKSPYVEKFKRSKRTESIGYKIASTIFGWFL